MAVQNLELALKDPNFAAPEKLAMVEFEKLSLTRHYDLMAAVLRADILNRIETRNLWSIHPNGYSSLEEAVQDVGKMSKSEFSNIIDLSRIIFPFVRNALGRSIVDFWDEYGKSNIREMTPYLKAIITNEYSRSDLVNQVVADVYQKVDKILPDYATADDRKRAAVNHILSHAGGTNKMLRAALRPDRTPPITMFTHNNGQRFIVAAVDDDQWTMLQRIGKEHFEFQPVAQQDLIKLLEA
jgi:uncharacterized protein YfbU (UPF0304 family)